MHNIKEAVCNNTHPNERGKTERANYRERGKPGNDDQFPRQGMTGTA
jgi:hypothetical protein